LSRAAPGPRDQVVVCERVVDRVCAGVLMRLWCRRFRAPAGRWAWCRCWAVADWGGQFRRGRGWAAAGLAGSGSVDEACYRAERGGRRPRRAGRRLSPLAGCRRGRPWVTAARAAGRDHGGLPGCRRRRQTAAASRCAAPGGGGQARQGRASGSGADPGGVEGRRARPRRWRCRPGAACWSGRAAIPARAGSTRRPALPRPGRVEVIPRPIPARMKPGSSTSQLDVAVRLGPSRPARLRPPGHGHAQQHPHPPLCRSAGRSAGRPVKEARVSGRNRSPAWTGE